VPDDCPLCQRINEIKANRNPFFVAELETSYVVLGDYHAWRGYTLLLSKECKPELHDLPPDRRAKFLAEMTLVAEAVWNVFKPAKLNYEMLGNLVPHMHWHIFPRHADDPDRQRPVWFRSYDAMNDPKYKLPAEEIERMKSQLRSEIVRLRTRR
jgi:diadenosine tetraphosphate (Ap4A) HIT family hydrolase